VSLLSWLTDPVPGRGVRIANPSGDGWEYREYPDLASSARRVAAALAEDGVRSGDTVCVLMHTGFEALTAFFAAWVLGATPCLISPPSFTAREEYVAGVAAILAQARPRQTVTSPELADMTSSALDTAGLASEPWLWRKSLHEAEVVPPTGLALLQFTSGSTGVSRGVRVSWDNLAANIALIQDWLEWRDGDVTASWLPLYHDMGLIGCLLTPVTAQCDLWLMRPSQFVRDPMRWLRCLAAAQHTAVPPFALDYVTRRVRPEDLAGLDLSGWRGVIVGAEPIDPIVLEDFARLLEPVGFRRSAYRTAYGLAEATLAVTAHTGPKAPTAVRLAPGALRAGSAVRIDAVHRIGDGPAAEGPGWLVGCGAPQPGFSVDVVDLNGDPLPHGHLGEIAVRGPSTALGYHAGATSGSTRFRDGELLTGDAGFVHNGELFVLGRMGDSLKLHGRSVFMEDLETAVGRATGLPKSRFAVVSVPTPGTPKVALLVESPPGEWVAAARLALEAVLGQGADIVIVSGRGGLVARTTSGKPRRNRLSALLAGGELPEGAKVVEEAAVS
jgi:acyl-CoA synthetase (AMP-forming)/AMP-acid ligase II